MGLILSAIPIEDHYKDVHNDVKLLIAPPLVARLYIVLQCFLVAAVFAIAYYFSASATSTETIVTFEILSSPYVCSLLSPRKDQTQFSLSTSESVQFSRPRYNKQDCLSILGDNGQAVCEPGNNRGYLISMSGVTSSSSNCKSVILANNYRFCYGAQVVSNFTLTNSQAFTTYAPIPSSTLGTNSSFYFTNVSGLIDSISAPFTSALTDYVSDGNLNVFTVATNPNDRQNYMYKFEVGSSSVTQLFSLTKSDSIYGIAAKGDYVYTFTVGQTYAAMITGYNLKTQTKSTFDLSCSEQFEYGNSDSYTGTKRYLSVGDDDYVYAFCSSSTTYNGQSGQQYYLFPFYKIDFVAKTSSVYLSDVSTANTTKAIDRIEQLLISTGYAYGLTGADSYSMVAIGLAPVPTVSPTSDPTLFPTLSPVSFPTPTPSVMSTQPPPPPSSSGGHRNRRLNENSMSFSDGQNSRKLWTSIFFGPQQPVYIVGNYGSSTSGIFTNNYEIIYFTEGNDEYYNISSSSFNKFTSSFFKSHYLAVAAQIGYAYSICNGNLSSSTYTNVDHSTSSSFNGLCGKINGMYYQNNTYYTIPSSCLSAIKSSSDKSQLMNCPAFATLYDNFVYTSCKTSFEKVCNEEFTDNPPFSCTQTIYPSTITTLGVALSNATFAWTVFIICFTKYLKKVYKDEYFFIIPRDDKSSPDSDVKSERVSSASSKKSLIHPQYDEIDTLMDQNEKNC